MIAFFVRHPTAGNLLLLFLTLLGLAALPGLQRETFPDFAAQELQIQVIYPGASAEDVEEAICQRLEDAIDGINDVEEMRCVAREGIATAVVEMVEGGDLSRVHGRCEDRGGGDRQLSGTDRDSHRQGAGAHRQRGGGGHHRPHVSAGSEGLCGADQGTYAADPGGLPGCDQRLFRPPTAHRGLRRRLAGTWSQSVRCSQ